MDKKFKGNSVFLNFGIWFSILTLIQLVQSLIGILISANLEMLRPVLIIEYLFMSLGWISILTIPIATLFASTSTYLKMSPSIHNKNDKTSKKTSTLKFFLYIRPAIILGISGFIVSLILSFMITPNTNHRIAKYLFPYIKEGYPPKEIKPRGDREKSFSTLLKDARIAQNKLKLSEFQKKRPHLEKIARTSMVEAYKKITIPLTALILSVFGSFLAILLSNLKTGRSIILMLFNIFVIVLIWFFLIKGEYLGDRGIIPPFISMILGPCLLLVLAIAIGPRAYSIFSNVRVAK